MWLVIASIFTLAILLLLTLSQYHRSADLGSLVDLVCPPFPCSPQLCVITVTPAGATDASSDVEHDRSSQRDIGRKQNIDDSVDDPSVRDSSVTE